MSCKSIATAGDAVPGQETYFIDPDGSGAFEVDCDMDGGGWIKLQITDSNSMFMGQHSPGNTWNKCDDDAARFFDWVNEGDVSPDAEAYPADGSSPGYRTVDFDIHYKQPSTGNVYTDTQMNALRSLPSLELHEATRIVALTADDDSVSFQDGAANGFEVRLQSRFGSDWKVMTPGTAPNCPSGTGQYFLWSTDCSKNEVHGSSGGFEALQMDKLPHDLVIPNRVRLDIYTGGGAAFGYEKEVFLVRESTASTAPSLSDAAIAAVGDDWTLTSMALGHGVPPGSYADSVIDECNLYRLPQSQWPPGYRMLFYRDRSGEEPWKIATCSVELRSMQVGSTYECSITTSAGRPPYSTTASFRESWTRYWPISESQGRNCDASGSYMFEDSDADCGSLRKGHGYVAIG